MRHPDPLIDEAIGRARETHPYYAAAINALRIVADPRVPTMATSAEWVTHYNPATVAGWTVNERAAVLVHEVEHLLRDHHGRCGDRDPARFNRAGDAEINQRLDGLPEGAIYPATLGMPNGATAETYYGVLDSQANAPKPDPKAGDGDGAGADAPGGPGEPGEGEPGAPGGGAPGEGDAGEPASCGSAAGGPTQPHETGDAANPGAGATDGGKAVKDTARAVLNRPGTDPGDERREWAESELGIDRAQWYSALATIIGRVAAPYGAPVRWRWPGRRDPRDMGGAMVPRWVGERPQCAVIIDTSSSITRHDMDLARSAGHFLARVADVTYWGCDTQADAYGPVMPETMRGGGGTAMRNGIDAAIEAGAKAVIVITDCETEWGADAPAVPVIVAANLGAEKILSGESRRTIGIMPWNADPPEWCTVLRVVQS